MNNRIRGLGHAVVRVLATGALLFTASPSRGDVLCELVIRVNGSYSIGSLGYSLDYSATSGQMVGVGDLVQCTSLVAGAFSAFHDEDDAKVLNHGVVAGSGFLSPTDVATCSFRAPSSASVADIDILVNDATTSSLELIVPLPVLSFSSVVCAEIGSTTSTSTTVTTTTTTTTSSTAGSTSTTMAPVSECTQDFTVVYKLNTASAKVGGTGFSVSYANASGDFHGLGSAVSCTSPVAGALFAVNDVDAERRLRVSLISLDGISPPKDLVTCVFNGVANDPPVAADFPVTVTEVVGVDSKPVIATGAISVSALSAPLCPCGNGAVDGPGEECDDGNDSNTDACPNDCQLPTCGDGYARAGVEQCDDGNAIDTDGCLSTCAIATCGDGFVRSGVEQCDDDNAIDTDACLTSCETAACGDGFVRSGVEECDDANLVATDACTATCQTARCGDGVVRDGVEQCDDANATQTDACLSTCVSATCGDGFVRSGVEQCDDSNFISTDSCTGTCQNARCGDGVVRDGVEACDDGNLTQTDACLSTCAAATCGDGFVRSGTEECDDGNGLDGDGCTPGTCQSQQICGDADDSGGIMAPDALAAMRAAVGLDVICPTWICDTDANGTVAAVDALRVLRKAVQLPVALVCGAPTQLRIFLNEVVSVGSLQVEVDYSTARFEIEGDADGVDCVNVAPDSAQIFNDISAQRKLLAGWVSVGGIQGRRLLARCNIDPTGSTRESYVHVKVVAATSPEGVALPSGLSVRAVPY